ncbi:MAG: lytic transglycosylase domain-containing protein [Candidatus Edwardsbacteria bacterium]
MKKWNHELTRIKNKMFYKELSYKNGVNSCLFVAKYRTSFFKRAGLIPSFAFVFFCLFLSFPPIFAQIYYRLDKKDGLVITNIPTLEAVRPPRGNSLYDTLIMAAAAKYCLDPSLIKAVIEAESGFNPKAVSSKGAMGLMQIMPETVMRFSVNDPFDPAENIEAGTHYLREMLDKFEGATELALAAYNAGPKRVIWYGEIPPFPETQKYVSGIISQYQQNKTTENTKKVAKSSKTIETKKPKEKKTRIYLFSDGQGNLIITNIPVKPR